MPAATQHVGAARPPQPEKERTWQALNGWAGVVGLIIVSLCVNNFAGLAARNSSTARDWLASPSGRFGFDFIRTAAWFSVAFLAAQSRSLPTWARHAGLARGPSLGGWLAAWVAVGVGLLELLFIARGWQPQSSPALRAYNGGAGLWLHYLCSIMILAPFCEEAVIRGFVYRAFRGNYSVWASTALVVAVSDGWFHWGLLSTPLSFLCLVLSTIALCLIRECTASTWNCVLFHAAHNAAVTVHWPFFVGGMFFVLPLCLRRRSKA